MQKFKHTTNKKNKTIINKIKNTLANLMEDIKNNPINNAKKKQKQK